MTLILLAAMIISGCGGDANAADSGNAGPISNGGESAAEAGASAPDPGPSRPMDEQTAELLFAIGVMPLQEAVSSENFVLERLGGGEARLDDHLGKVVFLNFWATWCPPCREEMPSMQQLYDELAPEGLEMIAVNVLEPPDTVRPFIEEHQFTYPVLLDTDGRVVGRYGVRAYPTTYVVDRDGYVLGVRPGGHDWADPAVVEGFRDLLAM